MPFLKLKLARSGRMWLRSSPASLPRSPFQVAVTYSDLGNFVRIYLRKQNIKDAKDLGQCEGTLLAHSTFSYHHCKIDKVS